MFETPYWHKPTQWVCPKHVPSALLPAHQTVCWYCGKPQPAGRPAPETPTPALVVPKPQHLPVKPLAVPAKPVVLSVPAKPRPQTQPPKPPKIEVVVAQPRPQTQPPKPPKIEVVVAQPEPPPQDKRRGATHMVACLTCGAPLWRRKKDIDEGVRPFCSVRHRVDYGKKKP